MISTSTWNIVHGSGSQFLNSDHWQCSIGGCIRSIYFYLESTWWRVPCFYGSSHVELAISGGVGGRRTLPPNGVSRSSTDEDTQPAEVIHLYKLCKIWVMTSHNSNTSKLLYTSVVWCLCMMSSPPTDATPTTPTQLPLITNTPSPPSSSLLLLA